MTHKFEQSDSGNDLLRARFTLWLNITLAHAKERYLDTHTEKFNIVPLRRWTKGYTIKQPNMDCQPTEITALMRHRAVFS